MTPDRGSLLPVALQAADIAADMMRTRRPTKLTEKNDRDLVSDVDLAIERQVREHLADASPGIGFLGEEEGQSGGPAGGWLWTLDPIDGTSNFAHGIPLCATSLALLHDGCPVLGVIDAPFLGLRYHAREGYGAYAGESRMSASSSQTGFTSPYAALDAILRDARYLLLDFDGPICGLPLLMPQIAAEKLRGIVITERLEDVRHSGDPYELLASVAARMPVFAATLDAELTSIELANVAEATVPGYVHEALAACRDSGRTSAIIGRQSADAVRAYLANHGLSDQTACVIATGSYPPGHLQTVAHLVEDAVGALKATPRQCAFITASPAGIDGAHAVGVQVIGYARTPYDREHLARAGATCIIPSLADLTLRLRAKGSAPRLRAKAPRQAIAELTLTRSRRRLRRRWAGVSDGLSLWEARPSHAGPKRSGGAQIKWLTVTHTHTARSCQPRSLLSNSRPPRLGRPAGIASRWLHQPTRMDGGACEQTEQHRRLASTALGPLSQGARDPIVASTSVEQTMARASVD